MNGRRKRSRKSSVGGFSLKDPIIMTGIKAGIGIVAGHFIGDKVGDLVAKQIAKDKTPDQQIQIAGISSGLFQVVGGIILRGFAPNYVQIANGMVSSGVVTAGTKLLKLDLYNTNVAKASANGIGYYGNGSMYLPGVAGGTPYGSTYLPGVAGQKAAVVIE